MGKSLICIFLALLGMGLSAWLRKEEQGSGASIRAVQPEITTQQWEKVETLEWPLMLGDSGLLALEMRAYDGPFLEDGSHDPVVGVAALMAFGFFWKPDPAKMQVNLVAATEANKNAE